MTIINISKMSVLERLQTMEALWDSLTHDKKGIESPQWHNEILSSRTKKIKTGTAEFKSLEKLKLKK